MFTVKAISKYGNEAIYPAMAVSYFSGTDDTGASDTSARPSVHVTLDDESAVKIDSGQVFVMNDAGKTVAGYRF